MDQPGTRILVAGMKVDRDTQGRDSLPTMTKPFRDEELRGISKFLEDHYSRETVQASEAIE
jgi:hypothetical protein